ncbi:MAG: hypothetical protein PHD57_07100 [Desulfobacterales bacterium]|jgi:phage gp29-like protein|nr:hypothetical protein [Desulfobacterales bacterium]MDD3081800.1 hypothetical protein [Desulfobacterales bacterium]MDD3949705.1 hypothetical protein [Desulfobacterales bacterium]MDD4462900.1 hypothetical protein [Desulfobacterales bacterium]
MMDHSDSKSPPNADFNQSEISTADNSDVSGAGKEEEILDLTDILTEIPEAKSEEPVDPAAYAQKADEPPMEAASEFPIETSLESAITPEVLENALERVVMRMFSEKIEPLLVEAVERGVQKEMERLRALLLEDVPDARKF